MNVLSSVALNLYVMALRKRESLIQVEKDVQDSFYIHFLRNNTFTNAAYLRLINNHIFYVLGGQGHIRIDGSTFPVSGNELFLLAKGQVYRFEQGTTITAFDLCFGDCFWEKAPASANNCKAVLFNNVSSNQHLALNKTDSNALNVHFETLKNEFNAVAYINKADVLAAYLKIVMIKIANLSALLTKANESYEEQIFKRFLETIGNHFRHTHEVGHFADMLGISTRKLSEVCLLCGGKGAKEIVNDKLIAEAKRSLQFSTATIKEIAQDLNFSTPDHFSHFFKKNTGLSPVHYRSNFTRFDI